MKKIGICTDLHFGIKRGSEIFLNSQLKFFKEQFVPELKKRKINTIMIPGDLFDNRTALDPKILDHVFELFENELKDFDIHILVGNHDSYYESSIHINSLRVLDFYKNVHIYEENTSIKLGNRSFFIAPWITKNEIFLEQLEKIEPHDICFGHFNFSNFAMFKDQESDHGLSPEKFYEKFKLTISGHYHTRSEKKVGDSRIVYIGNPFHFTRNDINDERGFSILDLETLELEFIENTKSIKFVKYTYPQVLQKEDIENNHVDIFIKYDEHLDEKKVDAYLERLESFSPAFPINKKTINTIEIDTPEQMKGTTVPDLIKEYMSNQNFENKEELLNLIFELYSECKEIL